MNMWKIKKIIEYDLITNKYLWKLVQIYTNKIKPFFIDFYLKYFKKYNSNKKIKRITSLKNMKFQITISTSCNANCVFCAYKHFKDKGMIMNFDTYKKIIKNYIKSGGNFVELAPTIGEVLINKDFFKMIKYAKLNNLYVRTFTNGLLLNKNNNYKKLIDSNPDCIYISVGDIDPKIDSKIYGINIKSSKERWKGINKLINYIPNKDKEKLMVGFRTIRAPYLLTKELKFKQILKKLGKTRIDFALKFDDWGGLVKKEDLIGIMKFRKPISITSIPCKSLNFLSIFPDGSVRLCGCRVKESIYDDLLIGNIKNNSLLELINSKKVIKIKKSFLNNNPPEICKNCSFYEPKI
jgi:radical SAM protein with 4Fe4S-binding SPASM domain